jgi:hypothetical protein
VKEFVDREEVTLVIPRGVTEVSVSAAKLCELFAGALLVSSLPMIEVIIDSKNDAVTSNDSRVKETMTAIMKARQLVSFYEQLRKFSIADSAVGFRTLRLSARGVQWRMQIEERRGLPDLHLQVRRHPDGS